MSDISKAWVWESYRGVVDAAGSAAPGAGAGETAEIPRLRVVSSSGERASGIRAKFGIAIALSIVAGAFFPLISLLLFAIAALLVASGREPAKTKDFLAGLPGGAAVGKALSQVDEWLA